MTRTAFCSIAGFSALLVIVALAAPAAAQEQRSSIVGSVRGTDGRSLAGVRVDARCANLPGGASSVSNAEGRYRFPALPPGEYEVAATLEGFQQLMFSSVRLVLGQTLEVDFVLKLGKTEEIIVTTEAPLIDTKASSVSTSIQSAQVNKLPRGRDFTSVVMQATGTFVDPKAGGITIDGASGLENVFFIDGQNTTNLMSGASGKNLIIDFIQETQVKSTGYPAEYGGAMGGVVNVITKSGSNEWKGEVGVYYSASGFDGAPNKTLRLNPTDITKAEYVTYSKDDDTRFDPGFQIGGPIVKEKLFFFAGYQPYFYDVNRTVTNRTSGLTGTYYQKETMQYAAANLSWQISPSVNARAAGTFNPLHQENVLPAEDGSDSPDALFNIDQDRPNTNVSLTLDWIANRNLYFGARGGWFRSNTHDTGISTGPGVYFGRSNVGMAGVPAELQQPGGYHNIYTNWGIVRDVQSRASAAMDGTVFFSGWGQHSLKAGLQYDRLGNDVFTGNLDNWYFLYWGRSYQGQRGTYGYYDAAQYVETGDVSSYLWALFAQDTWTISNRVTLNLGIRFESERVPPYNGGPTISFNFGQKVAPRAGIVWDLFGNGRSKLYASWGWFYDNMKLSLPRLAFGGSRGIDWFYTLDSPDWTVFTRPIPGCDKLYVFSTKSCPGTLINTFYIPDSNDPANNLIDPQLRPTKSQEFSVGYEQELAPFLAAGLRYVHKNIIRAIEDVGIYNESQANYFIANPGYGYAEYTLGTEFPAQPPATRDYDAVEIRLEKRYADNWYLRFSYTWSRLWGNYPGLASSDVAFFGSPQMSPNLNRTFDGLVMSFDAGAQPVYGVLNTDRTHQFKLNAIYDFPWNMTAGANFYMNSGQPISTTYWAQFGVFPVFPDGRADQGRTAWTNQFDLFLAQRFKFGRSVTLELNATILNLFDSRWTTNVFPIANLGDTPVDISDADYFAGRLKRSFNEQVANGQVQLNPRYLQPNVFQAPRTIRLGLKLMF